MKPLRLLLSALAAFAMPLVPAAMTAEAAPAKNWSATVTQAPDGGYLIGNPAARTRLVEYVSYTCPHCGHFVAEATAPLKTRWVAKGTVAIEIRNLVRDRFDLTAALLARCGGAARFAGNHEAIFANQGKWLDKASAYKPGVAKGADNVAVMTDIAQKTGLIALMQTRGVTPAQSNACIADAKALETLLALTKAGTERDGVRGTPSFLVNGKLVDAHDWAGLQPLLPAPAK